MNYKKMMYLSIAAVMIIGASLLLSSSAEEVVTNKNTSSAVTRGSIKSQDVSGNTTVSEVMTFDQLVEQIASDEGISLDKARSIVISNYEANDTGKRKSFASAKQLAESAQYRTLFEYVPQVPEGFQPRVTFYCEVSQGGGYGAILKIVHTDLRGVYNGLKLEFSGSLYVNLENGSKIHYILNGDFYRTGNTEETGNVGITLGRGDNISFSISNSADHAFYLYSPGDVIYGHL